MTTTRRTLRYKVLMVVMLVVVVAWCVLWFTAATVVDRHAEKAEKIVRRHGALAECVNRSIRGFPFSLELRCDSGSRVGNHSATLTLDGLVAAALIYQPSRLIVEVRGPVTLSAPNVPSLVADWTLAHASTRLDLAERAMSRFDVEIKEGEISAGARPLASFHELDLNTRRHPTEVDDLDVAVHFDGLAPLPGMEPVDLKVQGILKDGAALLSTGAEPRMKEYAADGMTFDVQSMLLTSGELLVEARGALTLGANGRLNGDLDVAFAGYQSDLPYLDAVSAQASETVSRLLTNVLAFAKTTTVEGRDAKSLAVTIKNGRVSAGIVPLFTIPAIRMPTVY